ncbi:hypothetical protein HRbin10_02258 [bacterium HR10]|nr:hypothetical protein HRbin10_02258 [bacterium HR10]
MKEVAITRKLAKASRTMWPLRPRRFFPALFRFRPPRADERG